MIRIQLYSTAIIVRSDIHIRMSSHIAHVFIDTGDTLENLKEVYNEPKYTWIKTD